MYHIKLSERAKKAVLEAIMAQAVEHIYTKECVKEHQPKLTEYEQEQSDYLVEIYNMIKASDPI